jgi:molybdate-binding protein
MKIKLNATIELDADALKQIKGYLKETGSDESVREFVRSWMLSAGIGTLEETIYNTSGEYVNIGCRA